MSAVCFSISGEFITEHARNLWSERRFSKCFDLLECVMGTTKEQHEGVIFGRLKLTGINSIALEPDDWTPPDHYCQSVRQAMKEGENFPELLNRREQDARDFAREEWMPSRGSKRQREAYWTRLVSLVGKDKAEAIHNEVMHDYADIQVERSRDREEAKKIAMPTGLEGVAETARRNMAAAMESAGMDASSLASPAAMLNRGYDITPTLDEKMQSENGWLLPSGKFYGCGGMEHVGLASQLLPKSEDAEKEAEELGWIKLAKTVFGFHCLGRKKPTKKQLTRLFDYAELHGKDYETLIASLPE